MIWIWIAIAVVSTIIIAVLAVRSRGQQQTWEERALDQRIALRLQQKEEEQQPMHTLSGDELRRALGRRYTLLMQESTIFIQIVEFEEQEDARINERLRTWFYGPVQKKFDAWKRAIDVPREDETETDRVVRERLLSIIALFERDRNELVTYMEGALARKKKQSDLLAWQEAYAVQKEKTEREVETLFEEVDAFNAS